ncbi:MULTISPECIES: ABC transporter permease [Pontibacillus]|uniref:ABC transporter permease n=1 Tax=Pontibacillus chungwhensis TaxID=265426 RepID=A0ABY8V288_9BACI|nr:MULTISPECIES: ABC transporter permease [Pontibacillus]MCD5322454.1 ABC transporter permease [Pontibacillus sp. HN14]WIF99740.1 ABC transporter permease [Pontibacillus chungwhensis]
MIGKAMRGEFKKLKHTNIITILVAAPMLTSLFAWFYNLPSPPNTEWESLYIKQALLHGQYLLPLLACLIAAYICKLDHDESSWKAWLVQPLKRYHVYIAKAMVALLLVALIQLLMFACYLIMGYIKGYGGLLPGEILLRGYIGGYLSAIPLIMLQLWVSSAWKSFAGAMGVNVVLTLPAILIAQSQTYGPWYPWSQPILAMFFTAENDSSFIPYEQLVYIIGGTSIVFFFIGLLRFTKRAY